MSAKRGSCCSGSWASVELSPGEKLARRDRSRKFKKKCPTCGAMVGIRRRSMGGVVWFEFEFHLPRESEK